MKRNTVGLLGTVVILAAGALAVHGAQDPPASAGRAPSIGVIDYYRVEAQAPQFAEAREALRDLEEEAAVLAFASSAYTMLRPEDFDRALALEATPRDQRTADQGAEVDQLRSLSEEAASRFRALLQLRPTERTPQTEAELDQLRGLQAEAEAHRKALQASLQERMDAAHIAMNEAVSAELKGTLEEVAARRGLDMVVQRSIRTVGQQIETGLPVIEYHQVVHLGGVDITDEVIEGLVARAAEKAGFGAS